MTTWIPRKDAGCVGIAECLPAIWGPVSMPGRPFGPCFRLWVIPPDSGYMAVYTVWRSEEGVALARGVIEGTTPPGVLADWCDENKPWVGTFTAYMGDVLRGWVDPGVPTSPEAVAGRISPIGET